MRCAKEIAYQKALIAHLQLRLSKRPGHRTLTRMLERALAKKATDDEREGIKCES